jgi:hypothetical protein
VPLTSSFAQSPAFLRLLEFLSDAPVGDDRFHARNFRLESEVPADRIKRFLGSQPPKINVSAMQSFKDLDDFHKAYLNATVRTPAPRIDPFSETSPRCPDTFRKDFGIEEHRPRGFLFCRDRAADHLVRVEKLSYMADNAQWQLPDALALLTRVANANRARTGLNDNDREDCSELFDKWQERADNRPMYAAFWGDVKGVLSRPKSDWPDELRDRLGLVHYDPALALQAIPVAAFRYPIKRIHKKGGNGRPLLVRSTILDGSLNLAFYTQAPGSRVGRTVDLGARQGDAPWREVVHPAIAFKPDDLWAVGEISAPVPKPMAEGRRHHSCWLIRNARAWRLIRNARDLEFAQLCDDIDGDL